MSILSVLSNNIETPVFGQDNLDIVMLPWYEDNYEDNEDKRISGLQLTIIFIVD